MIEFQKIILVMEKHTYKESFEFVVYRYTNETRIVVFFKLGTL